MARRANSCSPAVMERCFVGSSMTQMVAGKADCSHCSIVSPNNSGVRLFWTSQLTSHCVIYWTGGALFSRWMAIDSRHQLSIITAATDLMETALGHSKTHMPWVGWGVVHLHITHTHSPSLYSGTCSRNSSFSSPDKVGACSNVHLSS